MRESSLRERLSYCMKITEALCRLTEANWGWQSYPAIRERDSHSHENPTQRRLSEDGHSPLERTHVYGNIIIHCL